MFALALVALIALAGAAYQGYRIVEAIVQAERSAVIAWPTREPQLAMAQIPTSTPTAAPVVESETPVLSDGTGGPSPVASTETAGPTETPTAAETIPPAEPTPSPTPLLAQGPGDTSHISVVRDIVGASTNSGNAALDPVWGGRTSLTILIAGVDRRADGGDQNADVLIIARIDLINHRVSAVSLPRDLLVEIPGIGPDKVNGSYNYGVLNDPDNPVSGIAKVRDTIETYFGVQLDGYVLIDFDGFKDVVDAMDGIDVNVPYDIVDEAYPTEDYGTEVVTFNAGMQHMDGETALKYVRTRHADSDDARRDRQFQVMLALFDKAKNVRSVANADEVIRALGKSVQTSFPLNQQLLLARIGMEVDRSNIRLSSLRPPLLEAGSTADGKWVYVGDPVSIVAFVQDALITDPALIQDPANAVEPFGG